MRAEHPQITPRANGRGTKGCSHTVHSLGRLRRNAPAHNLINTHHPHFLRKWCGVKGEVQKAVAIQCIHRGASGGMDLCPQSHQHAPSPFFEEMVWCEG
eukprot:1160997-Pelagomonas_calceolata.AAC.19